MITQNPLSPLARRHTPGELSAKFPGMYVLPPAAQGGNTLRGAFFIVWKRNSAGSHSLHPRLTRTRLGFHPSDAPAEAGPVTSRRSLGHQTVPIVSEDQERGRGEAAVLGSGPQPIPRPVS